MDQVKVDNLTAARIVKYLITPFNEWDAHKLGLIDTKGDPLKEPSTEEEQKSMTLLHILCIKLRKLMQITPGAYKNIIPSTAGEYFLNKKVPATVFTSWSINNKSMLPGLVAAYNTVKEAYVMRSYSELTESFNENLLNIEKNDIDMFIEETGVAAIGTTSGGANDPNGQPPVTIKNKYKKQNEKHSFKNYVLMRRSQ